MNGSKSGARAVSLAWLSLLLMGCQSRVTISQGELADSIEDPSVRSVSFVTTRGQAHGRGEASYFSADRGEIHWGTCFVRLKDPDALRGDTEVVGVSVTGREAMAAPFGQHVPRQGPVVLYVHGYNISFEKGCRRAAHLKQNLHLEGRLLLFSWPADGNFLNYLHDVADLQWSGPQLDRVIMDLVDRFGAENVVVFGHSLGARGVVDSLLRLRQSFAEEDSVRLAGVILAAPDLDRDRFAGALEGLQAVAGQITVYTSSKDRALRISRSVNGYARLGEAGTGGNLRGLEMVDVSDAGNREITGHLYHLYNPAVVEDLRRLLGTADPAGGHVSRRLPAGDDGGWLLVPGES